MSEIKTYFSEADLESIMRATQEAEKNTSGEIRVKIINRYDENVKSLYQQALKEFKREGLNNTRDKTGVLVLMVLKEKTFMILADSGIHSRLPQTYWDNLARRLSMYFHVADHTNGLCKIVTEIGKELARYFPKMSDDVNELSDEVVLGDEQ